VVKQRKSEMKNINSFLHKINKVVNKGHCEKHDMIYNLFETPVGVIGSCPECVREKIKQEDEEVIKRTIKYRKNWQDPYIKKFERVADELKDATVANYKPDHDTQQKARRMAVDFVKRFNGKRSLVYSGSPGLGKSHLAYAITKGVRQNEYKSLFIKTTELLDLFKSTYEHGAALTEGRIFEVIETLDLLVLDDIGSEYIKPNEMGHETWASDILYKVMDLRLNKSLVCTTNYTESELIKKYGYNGERIISRMMQNADTVRLQGKDRRRKNRF